MRTVTRLEAQRRRAVVGEEDDGGGGVEHSLDVARARHGLAQPGLVLRRVDHDRPLQRRARGPVWQAASTPPPPQTNVRPPASHLGGHTRGAVRNTMRWERLTERATWDDQARGETVGEFWVRELLVSCWCIELR